MPAHKKYFNLPLVKTCEVCAVEFPRPAGYDDHRWVKAIVCSLSCASRKGNARKRDRRPSLTAMIAARIDKTPGHGPDGDCWLWTGSLDTRGYGRLKVDGKTRKATHLTLNEAGRPRQGDDFACHRCDNPPCVNPDHLFWGDSAGNMNDMVSKGRSLQGARHHKAKLCDSDVVEIREGSEAASGAAVRFGISLATVHAIRRRTAWGHVA